jgi:hypothetical protein
MTQIEFTLMFVNAGEHIVHMQIWDLNCPEDEPKNIKIKFNVVASDIGIKLINQDIRNKN